MDNIGMNITEYRKKLDLTQKDLGDMLNVSPQAVSKWENGQAEPDTSTIKRLCQIFKITTDELLGLTEPADETAAATAEQTAQTVQQTVEQKIINGYCEMCKKPVGPNEYVVTGGGRSAQHIYCHECNAKRIQYARNSEYEEFKRRTAKSLIWGSFAGVGAAALFAVLFIAVITLEPVWLTAIISVVIGIGYFAFVTQLFWDGEIEEVFFFFLKSFTLPGVIFTLDIDGIIFLILFKVIGAILCTILSVIIFLFGLILTPIISLVILPFAAIKRAWEGKRLKKAAQN